MERSSGAIRAAFDIQVDGKCGPGRPKMTWRWLTGRDCRGWGSRLSALVVGVPGGGGSGVGSAMREASQLSGRGATDVDVAPVSAR